MGGKLGTVWGAGAELLEDVGEDDIVLLIAIFFSRIFDFWKIESYN